MVRELRRGTQEAGIECIAFSPDNSKIACTSDHGTVHIFCAIQTPQAIVENDAQNKKSTLQFLGSVNKYFDSEWSFAKFTVDCPRSVCRFSGNDSLVALCADG